MAAADAGNGRVPRRRKPAPPRRRAADFDDDVERIEVVRLAEDPDPAGASRADAGREPAARRSPPRRTGPHGTRLVPVPTPPDGDRADRGRAGEDQAEEGRADGDRLGDVDEWGRSERMRELARTLFEPLYRHWFRVEWDGLEKIPTAGGALLVSNHAGAIPADAPSIMHGVETELGRPLYGLADQFFKQMPVIGTLWARGGGVVAHPDNAYRLLHDQGQLAIVFPEGTKATSKTFDQRYKLRRFGRGGFVEIAMRAGVPVVPLAVVGAEEAMPTLANLAPLAKLIGAPYLPLTANMVVLGPLGLLGYFPAKIKIRVLDPVRFDVEPGQPRYSRSRILEASEAIRARIQEALHEMLRQRRSVWFG